jgi:hypothetical protein
LCLVTSTLQNGLKAAASHVPTSKYMRQLLVSHTNPPGGKVTLAGTSISHTLNSWMAIQSLSALMKHYTFMPSIAEFLAECEHSAELGTFWTKLHIEPRARFFFFWRAATAMMFNPTHFYATSSWEVDPFTFSRALQEGDSGSTPGVQGHSFVVMFVRALMHTFHNIRQLIDELH